MKYVQITFIPGACGNFLCRALSLNNNCYAFLDEKRIPTSVEERYVIVSYNNVQDSWIAFENSIRPFTSKFSVPEYERLLPKDAVLISMRHFKDDNGFFETLPGPSDKLFNFIINIDSEEALLNTISNGQTKQSIVGSPTKMIIGGDLTNFEYLDSSLEFYYKNRDKLINISLTQLLDNNTFIDEFKRICNIIGIPEDDLQLKYVTKLYNEWKYVTAELLNK